MTCSQQINTFMLKFPVSWGCKYINGPCTKSQTLSHLKPYCCVLVLFFVALQSISGLGRLFLLCLDHTQWDRTPLTLIFGNISNNFYLHIFFIFNLSNIQLFRSLDKKGERKMLDARNSIWREMAIYKTQLCPIFEVCVAYAQDLVSHRERVRFNIMILERECYLGK